MKKTLSTNGSYVDKNFTFPRDLWNIRLRWCPGGRIAGNCRRDRNIDFGRRRHIYPVADLVGHAQQVKLGWAGANDRQKLMVGAL